MDWECSNRFSFAALTHHLTTKKKKKTHTVDFSCLICPIVLLVFLHCLLLCRCSASLNPPALLLLFFLSLSRHTLAKTDESGMFPHCTQQWMTAVLGGIVCVCVCIFSSLLFSLWQFIFLFLCLYTQNPHSLYSVSLPLLVAIFSAFRDI